MLRRLKTTKREILMFIIGFILSHYLDLRRLIQQKYLIEKLEEEVELDQEMLDQKDELRVHLAIYSWSPGKEKPGFEKPRIQEVQDS